MKIKKFVIENYKAIRGRKELVPDGASFFLLGGNGEGKTSAGHALIDMLTRKLPTEPITEGEKAGYLEFTMDNGAKLLCKFTEGKKPVMEFITPEGYNVGAPKELFQKLAGEGMEFNIDDFLKLQPLPLRKKLETIAGLDLSDITEREADAFEARKLAKAQLRDQQGRVQPYDDTLLKKEPVSAAKIAQEIQGMQKEQIAYDRLVDAQNKLIDEVNSGEALIASTQKDLDEYVAHVRSKIAGLQELVQASKIKLENQNQAIEATVPPDTARIEQLQLEMEAAEKTNQDIADAKRHHEEFLLAAELEAKVATLEASVKAIREEKEAKIKESPIPAEGVTFSEDGDILIDGLPFAENQIATSRKIIAGIQIAASMLGEIKYLHFDGASLDRENADRVLAYAEEKGLQLCIERPLWEGGELKFEIVDHTAQPEPVEA